MFGPESLGDAVDDLLASVGLQSLDGGDDAVELRRSLEIDRLTQQFVYRAFREPACGTQ